MRISDMNTNESKLERFLYNEYKEYLDLAKRSEDNRDKYVRLYVTLMTGLTAFASSKYFGSPDLPLRESYALPIVSFTIFTLSLVTYLVLISGRIGNIKCLKRVNLIRKHLNNMPSIRTEKLNGILLPITSAGANYYNPKSATLLMLYVVSAIMALSATVFFFAISTFLFKIQLAITSASILYIIAVPTLILFELSILIIFYWLGYKEFSDESELSGR